MKIRNGLYAFIVIEQVKLFVGRMQVIAVEPEAHEHDLNSQRVFQIKHR